VNALTHPNPGALTSKGGRSGGRRHALERHGQLGDPQLEVVDEPQADLDVASPRLGDLQAAQEFAAGVAEQVADRARPAEGDQRAVDAILRARAVTYQVQAKSAPARARDARPGSGNQIAASP
jgi:hypothetical protein